MYMMNWLRNVMPLILVNFLTKQIMMSRSKIVKIKYLVLLTELLLLLLLQLRMRYKTLLLLSKKKTDYDAKISEIEEK